MIPLNWRITRVKEGLSGWMWVAGPMSCSCKDTETLPQKCFKRVKETVWGIIEWMADHPPGPVPLPLPIPGPMPFPGLPIRP
jgi:hypothetical protein